MNVLRRIYSSFSEIVKNRRHFPILQAHRVIDTTKKQSKEHPLSRNLIVSDFEVTTCWGLSKLVVKDMQTDFDRTAHMVFIEFLEFICRIAHICQFVETDKRRVQHNDFKKKSDVKEKPNEAF